jgi:hypothetical protein
VECVPAFEAALPALAVFADAVAAAPLAQVVNVDEVVGVHCDARMMPAAIVAMMKKPITPLVSVSWSR